MLDSACEICCSVVENTSGVVDFVSWCIMYATIEDEYIYVLKL